MRREIFILQLDGVAVNPIQKNMFWKLSFLAVHEKSLLLYLTWSVAWVFGIRPEFFKASFLIFNFSLDGLLAHCAPLPPQSGQKLWLLSPLDIPDISGYQLGIGCQFVRALFNENPATYKRIFQIRFVSNLDICKIVIVCHGQHHVKAQVWTFENMSKTQIKAKWTVFRD